MIRLLEFGERYGPNWVALCKAHLGAGNGINILWTNFSESLPEGIFEIRIVIEIPLTHLCAQSPPGQYPRQDIDGKMDLACSAFSAAGSIGEIGSA